MAVYTSSAVLGWAWLVPAASVGGVTLFYFLIAPMLRLIWDRDPLDPAVVAERATVARDMLLNGLAGTPALKGATS